MYSPNIKSNVEPDIPGNTIADIAIIAHTKIYTISPKFKLFTSTLVPEPEIGLKYVMAATIAIPITVNIKYLYFPTKLSFSSLIITGIANIIKPKNKELTAYI